MTGATAKEAPRAPDFFCIGVQKAGTTWLNEALRQHPKIWMPPVKELQYFNQLHVPSHHTWTQEHRDSHATRNLKNHIQRNEDLSLRYVRLLAQITEPAVDDDWYRSIFSFAPEQSVCGEMTPEYSLLKDDGIEHLLSISPKAKIIFIMRDPIDRCWSHVRMIYQRSSKADLTLEHVATLQDIYDRSNYPELLERWRKHVSEDRLHVCFFDDIEARPKAFLQDILAFLGLDFDEQRFPNLENVVHKGSPLVIPDEIYGTMKERLAPVYDTLVRDFPEYAQAWRDKHF